MLKAMEKDEEKWEFANSEEPESKEQDAIAYEVISYPADYTLKGYWDEWKAKRLKIPEFQRSYVWDQVRASKLIESFLLGLPVPAVFLYKERNTDKLLIIDGQQRILSAINFFEGKFSRQKFSLKNVQKKWMGKTYAELDENDRGKLDHAILRATIVQQLSPEDHSSIYYIFERLNTGGINLTPMEIRKCLYSGKFFWLLEKLNEHNSWRKIIARPKADKRLRDVELVLRILALKENWQSYAKPMKQFLNNYMLSKNNLKEKQPAFLKESEKNFRHTCDFMLAALGEKPFHLRGPLNFALLESVAFAVQEDSKQSKEQFQKKFQKLLKNDEYLKTCAEKTNDDKVLKKRFELAKKFLSG